MKRIGSLFLAVVLAALVLAPAALAEGATFVVAGPETLPKAGETFEVTVSLTGGERFNTVGFKLLYHAEELRCAEVITGELLSDTFCAANPASGMVGAASLRSLPAEGVLAVYTFEALSDVTSFDFALDKLKLSREDGTSVPYTVSVSAGTTPAPVAVDTLPPAEEKPETTFTDLKDNWAKPYILKAAEKGIFGGYEDGSFRPDNPITRAQFVTVLWRMKGSPAPAAPCPFADMAGKNEDYRGAVSWGYEQGF
ncbi:MAG: S-layer homology domain-containing protein, partial [bacterium]